jgi:hypothetical protein
MLQGSLHKIFDSKLDRMKGSRHLSVLDIICLMTDAWDSVTPATA